MLLNNCGSVFALSNNDCYILSMTTMTNKAEKYFVSFQKHDTNIGSYNLHKESSNIKLFYISSSDQM